MTVSGKNVYVAGPMTGLPDFNRPTFHAAESVLLLAGAARVFNPGREPDGLHYLQYMRRGLTNLRRCNLMVRLPGWEGSRGAQRETAFAQRRGITIVDLPPCALLGCRLLSFPDEEVAA